MRGADRVAAGRLEPLQTVVHVEDRPGAARIGEHQPDTGIGRVGDDLEIVG